jgi:thymidylate synthase
MAELIRTETLSEAWLAGLEYLLDHGGTAVNLAVAFASAEEEADVRAVFDEFIAEWRAGKRKPVLYPASTVANTLFPQALYRKGPGPEARERLYRLHARTMRVQKRYTKKDSYFERLVNWPGAAGEPVNQLEQLIDRLSKQLARMGPLSSAYELGLSHPADGSGGEVRVYTPAVDRRLMSFPCLSHISFTLVAGRLHLAALYRNQDFVARAYGNYLGLARIGEFVAAETGCELGETLCLATHAHSGMGLGKQTITALIERCRSAGGRKLQKLGRV